MKLKVGGRAEGHYLAWFWEIVQDITWLPIVVTVPHFFPGHYEEVKVMRGKLLLGGYQ